MKKILTVLALAACVVTANAQRPANAIKKSLESAQTASQDAKKGLKPATWMGLAKVAMEAYNAPAGNSYPGASRQELQMIMGTLQPTGTKPFEVNGVAYTVDIYPAAEFYFDQNNVLQFTVTTKPVVENALEIALNAYSTASTLKGAKVKDCAEGVKKVSVCYADQAIVAYKLGDYMKASDFFAKAAEAAAVAPYSTVDSSSYYNSALTAYFSKEYAIALDKFKKCVEIDYLEGGDVYAKLADCYKNLDNVPACKETLEAGFQKCPENQAILVGLINYYLDTKEDPEKLFVLLDKAKANEPSNASLYYVEGNIRKQLGQFDLAIAAYRKCADVNPAYEFGYIGEGVLLYDQALEIQDKAQNEFNDKKYNALVAEFDKTLESAIAPLEKAFEVTKDNGIKTSLAEYLKNICYRLRDKGYRDAYDKYNAIYKNGIN